jgi:hypothetical protein
MQAKQIKIKKEVNVLHIDNNSLKKYWTLVEFMLKEGLKYDGNPMNIETLKEKIQKSELQLFMMFGSDDGQKYKVFGVFVTRVTKLPNYKQIEVILLKGEKRELWQDEVADMLEHLAVQNDCKKIAVHARPGWLKFLNHKGFKTKRYLYTKEIK